MTPIRTHRYQMAEFTPEDLEQIYSILREQGYKMVHRSRWTCESMTEWMRGEKPEQIRIRVKPCGFTFLRDPGCTLDANNWRWDVYQINNQGTSKWDCIRSNIINPFPTPSDWEDREVERKAREAREAAYEDAFIADDEWRRFVRDIDVRDRADVVAARQNFHRETGLTAPHWTQEKYVAYTGMEEEEEEEPPAEAHQEDW